MRRSVAGLPILCVDDDENLRSTLSHSLRAYGYSVIEAADAMRAMTIIKEHSHGFLALISDFEMAPGPSGAELIKAIHEGQADVGLYVLISGKSKNDPSVSRFLSESAAMPLFFLAKPFQLEELLSLLGYRENAGS